MQRKKPTRQLKPLRLRKEALKVLTDEQQLHVNAGSWEDPPTAYPICQNA
jgi:hypothetical protein